MPQYQLRSDRLDEAAAKKGDLSSYAIAKRTGLAESTLSRLRRGLASPATASLMKLSEIYGIPVDELIETAEEAA
jgi:transcriptional regulator with XRE-family HTH domain